MSLLGINKRGKLVVGGIVAFALIATASTGLAAWVIGSVNNGQTGEGNINVTTEVKDITINISTDNEDLDVKFAPKIAYKKDADGNFLDTLGNIITVTDDNAPTKGQNATEEDFRKNYTTSGSRVESSYPAVNYDSENPTDLEDLYFGFDINVTAGAESGFSGVKLHLFAADDNSKTLIDAAVTQQYIGYPFGALDDTNNGEGIIGIQKVPDTIQQDNLESNGLSMTIDASDFDDGKYSFEGSFKWGKKTKGLNPCEYFDGTTDKTADDFKTYHEELVKVNSAKYVIVIEALA